MLWGAACAACLIQSGCSDPSTNAAIPPATGRPAAEASPPESSTAAPDDSGTNANPAGSEAVPSEEQPPRSVGGTVDVVNSLIIPVSAAPIDQPPSPPKERTFSLEADGALRVGFDDLDLLKILKMDPVTPDCVEKMPGWLRGLGGKKVRIRGFMKPSLLLTGIPQFMFVRDTGLCCFGPKGKIYDMIAVTLKPGTTTDYIELRPFDVIGTFKIEMLQLDDDGTIYGLYYIDDAVIVQK